MLPYLKQELLAVVLLLFIPVYGWAQVTLSASGNQTYCPLSTIHVVTDFSISSSGAAINAIAVQISEGYVQGEDTLAILGNHPNISANWLDSEGKLVLNWNTSNPVDYSDFIAAVKNVVFESSSNTPSNKAFSITLTDANYLPSTGHFYQFISDVGITWTAAKTAAESLNYYGLQGYLATITSSEEAQLSGEQVSGSGWIGGSDAASEGTWKWVTGPENGTIFWNGGINGSSPNFANWNNNEPNNQDDEDYAHVTAPNIGTPGSWNDLSNTGAPSGDYQPKGFVVEYGGMPGDPQVNISASTSIEVPKITSQSNGIICDSGVTTLSAVASVGNVYWFENETGGNYIYKGNNYTTPVLNSSKTYYVVASDDDSCITGERTPVVATVNQIPEIISVGGKSVCESGSVLLWAKASEGDVLWYASESGGVPLALGDTFQTPIINNTTTFYAETSANNCVSTARVPVTVTVFKTPFPTIVSFTINDLLITENSNNNQVAFNADNSLFNVEDYTYALDDASANFQDELFFENIYPGLHVLYLKSKSNCGIATLKFPILGFPKYFTPNNDGINDTWNIVGFNNANYQLSEIIIFNRFGKIVAVINPNLEGWDGTYNGEELPGTDYWFSVIITDKNGATYKKQGNFTLVRR